jgi:hypothetical protein
MAARFAEETHGAALMQFQRDERLSARGAETASGTDGAPTGANGAPLRVPKYAYAGAALFIVVLLTVSALTVQHDAGPALEAWKPFVSEYTAAVMILAAMPAVAFVTVRTAAGRGKWLRFAIVHLLGSVVFCAAVVGGFVLLRKLIFAAMGRAYVFGGLGQLIYEYRKIALAYCGMVVVFYLSARLRSVASRPADASQLGATQLGAEATFDIRDGAKLIRVAVGEILSVRSAGNYVEFHLADGRRPLMRSTLSNLETALRPQGFLRTHRSWVINPLHLRALEPEGSGDWRILLEGGAEAPPVAPLSAGFGGVAACWRFFWLNTPP